jgi:hypothetical protein
MLLGIATKNLYYPSPPYTPHSVPVTDPYKLYTAIFFVIIHWIAYRRMYHITYTSGKCVPSNGQQQCCQICADCWFAMCLEILNNTLPVTTSKLNTSPQNTNRINFSLWDYLYSSKMVK